MSTVTRFDRRDFTKNPGKYQLFKTARLAGHLFTANGDHDLPVETVVGVEWVENRTNPIGMQVEPVYRVRPAHSVAFYELYGSALGDFCL